MKLLLRNLKAWYKGKLYQQQYETVWSNLDPGHKLILVDIDNTLADTWPTLKPMVYDSHARRYQALAIFRGMRTFVLNILKQPETTVVYLSARPLEMHATTQQWLESNGLWHSNTRLVLVYSAAHKLKYIEQAAARFKHVTCIDDLCYGHESGTVKFYSKLINHIKKLPITYIGFREIAEIHDI